MTLSRAGEFIVYPGILFFIIGFMVGLGSGGFWTALGIGVFFGVIGMCFGFIAGNIVGVIEEVILK